ncbi:MAG: YlbF family regulator [Streptococcus gallolyticus]|nr:YlbF family regulator [Streptococcus gallolyticus]
MKDLETGIKALQKAIENHESVVAFRDIEHEVKDNQVFARKVRRMKQHQQEAVLFDKIGKRTAAKLALGKADMIEEELLSVPIIQEYRARMQDASDLMQYVTGVLEDKINEELGNG